MRRKHFGTRQKKMGWRISASPSCFVVDRNADQ
jgi:hypothetical protein